MLDYDMLASPNYIRGVYDGDGDDAETGATPGRAGGLGQGRGRLRRLVQAQGLESARGAFDGRSDYVGFTDRGIPSGGVFAGAEGVKTAEEEAIYGGAAGSWYDPCYHQICDNLTTVLTGVPPLDAEGFAPERPPTPRSAPRGGRWPVGRSRASRSSRAPRATASTTGPSRVTASAPGSTGRRRRTASTASDAPPSGGPIPPEGGDLPLSSRPSSATAAIS